MCSTPHVYELNYNNANWSDQDITVGGNTAIPYAMLAFPTTPNNQFHVYYLAESNPAGDLHQLYFNGTSWSDQDLTSITGGAICEEIAGFAIGNLQHIFCSGETDPQNFPDMVHVYYNNSTWLARDITQLTHGSTLVINGNPVAAFSLPKAEQLEAYGFTNDLHVHQYTRSNPPLRWNDTDLTATIGAPTDASFGSIAAFQTKPNGQFHIFYAPTNEVYQLYFNGTAWSVEDLTGGVGQADSNGWVTGFATGNLQHVFYMTTQ